MTDLRKEIVAAGYKALLTKSHPDAGPASEKTARDERCKQLAVARNWLVAACDYRPKTASHPQPVAETPYPGTAPLITPEVVDRIFENLVDIFSTPKKRTRRISRKS